MISHKVAFILRGVSCSFLAKTIIATNGVLHRDLRFFYGRKLLKFNYYVFMLLEFFAFFTASSPRACKYHGEIGENSTVEA